MSLEVNSVGKYFVQTASVNTTTGVTLDALTAGQVYIYNEDGTPVLDTATDPQPFFVATKLSNGEVVKTPLIDPSNVRYSNAEAGSPGITPVFDIENICTSCNKDYAVKFDILNASAFVSYGFQAYTKLFTAPTSCCTGTSDPCVEVVRAIRDSINADDEGIFTAIATNPATNAELNDAALDAWDVDANGCPNIRVSVVAQALTDFCGIPYKYSFPTGVSVQASLIGFDCCTPAATVTEVTGITYPKGAGPDVKYLEWYHSKNSFAESQYNYAHEGIVFDTPLNTDVSLRYSQLIVAFDDPMRSGFLKYDDPQTVTVAIATALEGELDALLAVVTGNTELEF